MPPPRSSKSDRNTSPHSTGSRRWNACRSTSSTRGSSTSRGAWKRECVNQYGRVTFARREREKRAHLASAARITSIWLSARRNRSPSRSLSTCGSVRPAAARLPSRPPAPFVAGVAASTSAPSDNRPSNSSEPKTSRGGVDETTGVKSSSRMRKSSYVPARETSGGEAVRVQVSASQVDRGPEPWRLTLQ